MTRSERVRILANSKVFERRICRALGFERFWNDGSAHSDACDTAPISLECTRTKNPWRHARKKWLQAIGNANREGRPPVMCQGEPGQRIGDVLFTCEGELFLAMWEAYRKETHDQRDCD